MSRSRYVLAAAVLVTAAAFAGARVAGEKGPAFQAFAHLLVGGLCVYAVVRRSGEWWRFWAWQPVAGLLAFVLSAIELAAFLFLPR